MLIKRTQYLENIRRFYESNLIKVLTGIRRCGKSVLLSQIKDELRNSPFYLLNCYLILLIIKLHGVY